MITTTEPYATPAPAALGDKHFDRISWGAIFAGTLAALALQLVFSLLGLGLGLIMADPQPNEASNGAAVSIGAMIWWAVSSLVSLFAGGFVAGRMAGTFSGYIHGAITWATVTIGTLLLLGTTMGATLRGVTGLAQLAAQHTPQLQQQMPGVFREAQAKAQEVTNRAEAAASDPTARREAERQIGETAQRATKAGGVAALGAAVALMMGAIACGLGGSFGHRKFLASAGEVEPITTAGR